jgi:hypothetical protein
MTISFSRLIYFTCLHTSFLVQPDHTPWVWSNFFTPQPQDILPIQFHTHISNFMFQKSTPTLVLYFLGSHLYIYKWVFIFYSQAYQIQHYFHKHKLCQQHEAITLSYSHYIFYLTFRDYCGINLLLGHQYGSHYLYLNLKSNVVNCSSVTCILGLPTSPFLSAVQTARS